VSVPEPRVRTHGRFESAVRFDLVLTCRTGLHIGAGKSAALVGSDLPVLRDAAGRPLVPGSSLRGILRSGVEALCGTLDLDSRLARVDDDPDLPDEVVDQWNAMGVVDRMFGRIAKVRGDFSYASRLQLSDCHCTGTAVEDEDAVEGEVEVEGEVHVELRDGVAINRELRTAADSAKFDVEVVPAGTRFRGSVKMTNPDEYEIGLLAQALWMLDQGMLLLGGKSARGLGWMKVRVGSPQVTTARSLLDRGGAAPKEDAKPKPVDHHLASYLEALRKLADAPPIRGGEAHPAPGEGETGSGAGEAGQDA
jgi:CRISPR-associated RAMP protein (TIGR02581 family)